MGKQTTGLGHVTVKDLKRLTLPFNEETAVSFNQAAMPLYEQIFKNLKEIAQEEIISKGMISSSRYFIILCHEQLNFIASGVR